MADRRDVILVGAAGVVLLPFASGLIEASSDRLNASNTGQLNFNLSNAGVITAWNSAVMIGSLIPINAPAGAYFVLVDEPAGIAVVNG
jgi:hypothetical protein